MDSLPDASFLESQWIANLSNVAALTIFFYDSLLLIPDEVEYIYSRKKTFTTVIYTMSKVVGVLYFPLDFLFSGTEISVPLYVINHLLLPCITEHKRAVMILLWVVISIEIAAIMLAFITIGVIASATAVPTPPLVDGCALSDDMSEAFQKLLTGGGDLPVWCTRVLSTAIEMGLLLFKLYQYSTSLNRGAEGHNTLSIRKLSPLLYVFYRDGLVFLIPAFAFQIMGFAASPQWDGLLANFPWATWLMLTYYICGTRLILHLRRADYQLGKSRIVEEMSTLRFQHVQGNSHQNTTVASGYV
ncbi:hypothetical protein NP233_g8636 [Leucocoprinus birnbaumii]|uniref:DUF6533 domain-containing protein n=1 Tax=Leucocoprinus birnbaumii TaxID=56174 RepID=A0AAD5YNW4_9AGAR|nr:hypothetical protein NP233_g8636 [Leucocoprinus birnbaumii]